MKVKCNATIDDMEQLEDKFDAPPKFKKQKSKKAEPFIVECHYTPHGMCNWGWSKHGSYSSEKRANQALEQMKKCNKGIFDAFRMYDERVDKPGNVLWPLPEVKWVALERE